MKMVVLHLCVERRRHVIDLGFYKDGIRAALPAVGLGSQFWEDPSQAISHVDSKSPERRNLQPDAIPAPTSPPIVGSTDSQDVSFDGAAEVAEAALTDRSRFVNSMDDSHDLICADDHQGKLPESFVDHARASRATRFAPHLAISIRLYAFPFGICGLSDLHFRWVDRSTQISLASLIQLSSRKHSVGISCPAALASSHADQKAAVSVLGTYSDEIYSTVARLNARGQPVQQSAKWWTPQEATRRLRAPESGARDNTLWGSTYISNGSERVGGGVDKDNYKRALEMESAPLRSIRDEQGNGTYLVLDDDVVDAWPGLHISSFGCYDIYMTYHSGPSVSDASNPDDPPQLTYDPVGALAARRIELIKSKKPRAGVKLKRGDVKTTLATFTVIHGYVQEFLAPLRKQGVVKIALALPFGPPTRVFGNRNKDQFFGYPWVDDHVIVEEDRTDHLKLCKVALRLAILAILGPRSINGSKFTPWATSCRALGLDWDTARRTVSMPPANIAKALLRVRGLRTSRSVSRTSFSYLLGSLRHVYSRIRIGALYPTPRCFSSAHTSIGYDYTVR
ncbi:hypothetical protein GN958_ATG09775 [Phytophthora infestans]|uniref:Uncharacterized protein n=1 Tax=Phytophthora infestans TaxID=4787 RepID=A0A8S9UN18_PHYIN|nr:hypothetical protein GN958_ATG09775 [Phytophthora infestans]